jgi:hypothetical protein
VASCPAGHQVPPRQAGRCPLCRRDQVTDIASAADGSLPRAVIEAAVEAVAPSGQALRQLALALTWLFPGHLPGRPITPATLGERLRAIGIYAKTGRRAALLDLAAQIPAAVLADVLGLHATTAAKWMHQAGGDWSRYAADLARRPHQT